MPRLIPGDFDAPDGRYQRYWGRVAFLEAVRIHVPEAITSLEPMLDDSLDDFSRARAMDAWVDRWHLQDDWASRAVWHAVEFWRLHPTSRDDAAVWAADLGVGLWPDGLPSVNSDLTTASSASIAAALKQRGVELKDQGFRRVRESVSARKDARGDEHFTWTALYQVAGTSYAAIAQETRLSPPTVHQAVEKVASMIGLTLRKSRKPR
jgi:hypothetical protein